MTYPRIVKDIAHRHISEGYSYIAILLPIPIIWISPYYITISNYLHPKIAILLFATIPQVILAVISTAIAYNQGVALHGAIFTPSCIYFLAGKLAGDTKRISKKIVEISNK